MFSDPTKAARAMRLQECAITRSRTAVPRPPATAISLLVVLACAAVATWLGASRADAIIGGQPAASNEYPWMVKLEDCSGSLIAPDWVLTASHCIVPGQSNAVWIGGVRWGDGERRYWNRSVELAPFATGDQTLLHLSTPSTKPTLSYNATATFGTVGPMTAVGYGESCATCTDEILRSVANLPAVDSGDGFITTGVGGSNRTICLGDSGGPLVKRHDGRWLQVGVHSYTIRPNCTGLAGHTATAQFAPDIERITGRAPLRPQPPQIDTQRPNPPRGLTMSTDGRTLRWIAAVDNVGVSHYTIHRSSNGTVGPQIGQTLTTTYRDTSAQPGVRYTYAVKARDAAGNVSWRSNIARTPSTDGPRCTKQAVGTDVSISVSGMTADRYAIRANGTWVSSRPGGQTSYTHSDGRVGDRYVVRYYQPDRTDIVCTDQATVPACSVAARNGGVQVTVSNMAADRYAVRVDGRWVASVDDPNAGFFHPGGSTADQYVVRYYKPNRIDLTCTR